MRHRLLGIRACPQNTFNSTQPGQRGDWREVEGCYVLYPPAGRAPQAVAHFLGGAFVGAAPQVAYRLFLEALANRDVLVRGALQWMWGWARMGSGWLRPPGASPLCSGARRWCFPAQRFS